jgi:AraC-like DNA-binding protein
MTDALTDLLRAVSFESALVFRAELTAPWGVRLPGDKAAAFHFVLRGRARVELEGAMPLEVCAGDLVVLPQDRPHVVRDEARSDVVDFEVPARANGLLQHVRLGGEGAATSTLSACFHLAGPQLERLLGALPPIIHLPGGDARGVPWLDAVLQSLAAEASAGRPGGIAIVTRLAEVVFVHAVRRWLETSSTSTGWAAALRDPQLAQVLSAVRGSPETKWTVERLARTAGMSRSAFAERFAKAVGEPPVAYVTRWRMHRAAELLRERGGTIASVAAELGYASEAAFSRMFKRVVGETPAAWRRRSAR